MLCEVIIEKLFSLNIACCPYPVVLMPLLVNIGERLICQGVSSLMTPSLQLDCLESLTVLEKLQKNFKILIGKLINNCPPNH